MSDSVMYPEAGRWVNSYLVGANAYKIMSTPEEAQQLLLDDSGDFLQTGTEHHYIQVRCRNENKPLWLVPFRVKQEELLRVSDVLEQIQMGRILREGFSGRSIWSGAMKCRDMCCIPSAWMRIPLSAGFCPALTRPGGPLPSICSAGSGSCTVRA